MPSQRPEFYVAKLLAEFSRQERQNKGQMLLVLNGLISKSGVFMGYVPYRHYFTKHGLVFFF
jgi:hypothetical protein